MTFRTLPALAFAVALVLAGCGSEPGDGAGTPADTPTTSWRLAADLPDALSILDARSSPAGDEVAVYGRVRDIVPGFAAFTLIDEELEYCGEACETKCPTPWDYCCLQSETIAAASLPVEVRDAKGDPVEATNLDLRHLDLVALRGKLIETESGGLMLVVKDGWFRRERPELGDHVRWP